MKIKNYIWVVLVIGITAISSVAQKGQSRTVQGMSVAERAAAVDTNLRTACAPTPKTASLAQRALSHDAKVFSADRVGNTLTGVWRGRVSGNFEKRLIGKDGSVNVDYYMIIDMRRGEALVFEQFGSQRSVPAARSGAPVWSYVACGVQNYEPRFPAQVHEFQKVSDNLEAARAILRKSTGLRLAEKGELVLADVWQQLVDTKYFDNPKRSLAYAGAFFKPFKAENVASGSGSLFSVEMTAEYRGSGETAAKFTPGVPIRGSERGKFLGVPQTRAMTRAGARTGDFLVSAPILGTEMRVAKESTEGGLINMAYDKVVVGPLGATAMAHSRGDRRNHRSRAKNHRSKN